MDPVYVPLLSALVGAFIGSILDRGDVHPDKGERAT
jgi:hypothetical protein